MSASVSDYKDRYTGRLAILLSGTTAREQDLSRITCPILGVNQSYRLGVTYPRTPWHMVSGKVSSRDHVPIIHRTWPHLPIFGVQWPLLVQVPGVVRLKIGGPTFSLDLATKGIYCLGAAVMSLQLAVHMGFTEIIYVGLDLKRRAPQLKAYETEPNPYDCDNDYRLQAQAMREGAALLATHRPHVKVMNVSHDTNCDAFPVRSFDEVFA